MKPTLQREQSTVLVFSQSVPFVPLKTEGLPLGQTQSEQNAETCACRQQDTGQNVLCAMHEGEHRPPLKSQRSKLVPWYPVMKAQFASTVNEIT
jgi:hypothetical protein